MNSCAYCGEASCCFDHVIPRQYLSPNKKRTGKEVGFKVPSCSQCNSILGDRIFKNLVERKEFVHKRLRVKLRKHSARVMWDEEEMAEMGPVLRSTIEIAQAKTDIARDRIAYSGAPPEAKWLKAEELWRESYGDRADLESGVRLVV